MKSHVVRVVVVVALVLCALYAGYAVARADPYQKGCLTTPRPILLNWIQKRTICDGPRRADGSWERTRAIWTPAHTTSASSYCGTYSCSYTPSRYYDESVQEFETYVVFDSNVLPDEPGWLPPGSLTLR